MQTVAHEAAEPIDVVYTWVDDSFPGYSELLRQYSETTHDRNPNRTRDNIEVLKYSLRSVAAYLPFVRHIYIVSCRPQVPRWLAVGRPGLSIVHHDALLDSAVLPTFNSFAIVSSISRIPGLSRRFFYVEDDMLFTRTVGPSDFVDESGRLRLFRSSSMTYGPEHRNRDDLSPWNTALAHCNHLLDEAFGPQRRRQIKHHPLLLDRDLWEEMLLRWQADFDVTRRSRFRAKYNVPPECLYPYYLYYTGRARMESMLRAHSDIGYCALDNFLPPMQWRLALLRMRRLKTLTLNDSFGARPNPKVVAAVSAYLEKSYPKKSPFEI